MTTPGMDKIPGPSFTERLLHWNRTENRRQMPWKGEKDPYRIWLSEIILQQTRVDQGLKYYERFVSTFPTIQHLAAAPDQQVFKLWEGLGYYTRCKNLLATARYVSETLNGTFPHDYAGILALKGVGAYTAAAIASFAYNLPYAVVDGNVLRVLARIGNVEVPVDTAEGKKYFATVAQQHLPPGQAGAYNQAIMDFGATICKPAPECAACFFRRQCRAFLLNRQLALPVKLKQVKVRERWFHYILLQWNDAVALRQRTARDIWQQLYEPLLLEAEHRLEKEAVLEQLHKSYSLPPAAYEVVSAAARTSQRLTHQQIHFSFFHLQLKSRPALEGFTWVSQKDLPQYPFPKTLQAFIAGNLS